MTYFYYPFILVILNGFFLFLTFNFNFVFADFDYSDFLKKPINLSNDTGKSFEPQILVSGYSVFVVWTDNSTGNEEIYFTKSHDFGNTFDDVINLSNNYGSSHDPKIAVNKNNVYITWTDNSTGNEEIYFTMSNNNGNIFTKIKNLSNNFNGTSKSSQIAVYKNIVYVVWDDDSVSNEGIRMKISINNGNDFSISKVVSSKGDASAKFPYVKLLDNGNIAIAWISKHDGYSNVFFRILENTTFSFSKIKTITSSLGEVQNPKIGLINENIIIFWEDNFFQNSVSSKFDIKYKISQDKGMSFSLPKYLIHNVGDSLDVKFVTVDNMLYTIWRDDTNSKILSSSTNTINKRWDLRIKPVSLDQIDLNVISKILNNSTGRLANSHAMGISYKDQIFVAWSDIEPFESSNQNTDIFFATKLKDNNNFQDFSNLSNNQGNSTNLKMSVTDEGMVFVVWVDTTDGNEEIYFKGLSTYAVL